MCEKGTRKVKKGSRVARMREARRTQRLRSMMLPSPAQIPASASAPAPPSSQPVVDKNAQCQLILELAWKTVTLMQKNSLIQQKIVALQKETSEYVASVMNNPENRQRYLEHMRAYGGAQAPPKIPTPHNSRTV